MPDLTTASAMPLIMSSLTLQPNLFHEFHPIGGVGASALGFTVFSCAGRPAVTTKTANTTTATEPLVFMSYVFIRTRCICVQRRLKRGKVRRAATSAITILRSRFSPSSRAEAFDGQGSHTVAGGVGWQFFFLL